MDVSKFIKVELAKNDMNQSNLAELLGITRQNVHIRMTRNAWKVSDLERIADALNCDLSVEFIKRES